MGRPFNLNGKAEEIAHKNFFESKKANDYINYVNNKSRNHTKSRLHEFTVRNKIKDLDSYIKDPLEMETKEKAKYIRKMRQDVQSYKKYLTEEKEIKNKSFENGIQKGVSPKTLITYISTTKQFLEYNDIDLGIGFWKRVHNGNKARTVSTKETPSLKELKEILSQAEVEGKALFLIQATSGSRIGEILTLEKDEIDINYDSPRFIVPPDKNKKGRNLRRRFSPEAKEYYLEYLKVKDKTIETRKKRSGENHESINQKYLFPMSVKNAEDKWLNLIDKAGYLKDSKRGNRKTMTTHCLRRFFKTQFKKASIENAGEWAKLFMGQESELDRDYDDFTDDYLDEKYAEGVSQLLIEKEVINPSLKMKKLEERIDQLSEDKKSLQNNKRELTKELDNVEKLRKRYREELDEVATLKERYKGEINHYKPIYNKLVGLYKSINEQLRNAQVVIKDTKTGKERTIGKLTELTKEDINKLKRETQPTQEPTEKNK